MKLVMLYHPHSEFARQVETFARDFQHFKGSEIELVSLESREGADTARLHDIVRYPALLAIRENGSLARAWQDDKLPLMDEVASYLVQ